MHESNYKTYRKIHEKVAHEAELLYLTIRNFLT